MPAHDPTHNLNWNYGKGCRCAECRKNHGQYYLRKREHYLAANKEYRMKHSDKIVPYKSVWHETNREVRLEQMKEYAANHLNELLNRQVRQYGITYEEYMRLLESQKGVCAICRRPSGKRRLAVDHDHKTKVVRGLLCSSCNLALGHFQDSPQYLDAAIQYLQRSTNAPSLS